ncbi:MAG: helix-turn-helix transcriptional regulator [Candidatus Aminicenantes bacterium]|nr:helix-turn-helix transcriptional regulator [Candidatus Aminicenantes bacterium]
MKLLTRAEELILWAVLRLKKEAYCLPIHAEISRVTDENWSLGSIYMPLDRLVKKGYLVSRLSDSTPERGGRRKRIYRLTPEGYKALKNARKVQDRMWEKMPGKLEDI